MLYVVLVTLCRRYGDRIFFRQPLDRFFRSRRTGLPVFFSIWIIKNVRPQKRREESVPNVRRKQQHK